MRSSICCRRIRLLLSVLAFGCVNGPEITNTEMSGGAPEVVSGVEAPGVSGVSDLVDTMNEPGHLVSVSSHEHGWEGSEPLADGGIDPDESGDTGATYFEDMDGIKGVRVVLERVPDEHDEADCGEHTPADHLRVLQEAEGVQEQVQVQQEIMEDHVEKAEQINDDLAIILAKVREKKGLPPEEPYVAPNDKVVSYQRQLLAPPTMGQPIRRKTLPEEPTAEQDQEQDQERRR